MKPSEILQIPENYRKVQDFSEFSKKCTVYYECRNGTFVKGEVLYPTSDRTSAAGINWGGFKGTDWIVNSDDLSRLYIQDTNEQLQHPFKVNDRVQWVGYDSCTYAGCTLTGVVATATDNWITVKWDKHSFDCNYEQANWKYIKLVPEVKLPEDKPKTTDYIVEGVKATLAEAIDELVCIGKYEEAREVLNTLLKIKKLQNESESTKS